MPETRSRILMALPPPGILRKPPASSSNKIWIPSCFVVDPLLWLLAEVREQSGLLVVGVHRAGGDDVIFYISVHQ